MSQFVRGDSVQNPAESLRLFAICQAMNWSHLPSAGGLYDQHPQLLDEWLYIFQEQHAEEGRKSDRQKAEMERTKRAGGRKRLT